MFNNIRTVITKSNGSRMAIIMLGALLSACEQEMTQVAEVVDSGFAAIPGQKGGQDMFGPYEVAEGWPQDLAELPDHEGWT